LLIWLLRLFRRKHYGYGSTGTLTVTLQDTVTVPPVSDPNVTVE
jgi:hypothetical protein